MRFAKIALLWLCLCEGAHAALIDRGGGLIYDEVLDVTWAQDAFLWGQVGTWSDALAWAAGLDFGGFSDWRLPNMDINGDLAIANCALESELACRDNEYGYMYYYNLGGSSGDDLTGNQGPFINIGNVYWSGTPFAPPVIPAWGLLFATGAEGAIGSDDLNHAWAVRDGDVPVPEPLTALLVAIGAGVLWLTPRYRRV